MPVWSDRSRIAFSSSSSGTSVVSAIVDTFAIASSKSHAMWVMDVPAATIGAVNMAVQDAPALLNAAETAFALSVPLVMSFQVTPLMAVLRLLICLGTLAVSRIASMITLPSAI